jgi:hypothetical protein
LFLILIYSTIPIHHYRELKMSQDPNSWAQHLAAIDAEGITTKAYADREGLSAYSGERDPPFRQRDL